MIKGLIFDYGATLDTNGCHWGKVLWRMYQRLNVPIEETEFRKAYVFAEHMLSEKQIIQPDFTFYQTLHAKIDIQMDYLRLAGFVDVLTETAYNFAKKNTTHSREVLIELRKTFPMILVSNFYGNIGTVLQEFEMENIFTQVIESAVVGIRKPNPQIFTIGINALGLMPQEVMMVGDSLTKDILPAQQAGCMTTWLKGEQWTEANQIIKPDAIITDLQQVYLLTGMSQ